MRPANRETLEVRRTGSADGLTASNPGSARRAFIAT